MSREKTMHELVTAAKAGDQEAITLLYERTSNKAYYLSFQLVKDEDTAQDILQDAYIKAFGSLDMLSDPEKFQGWLDTTVVNKSKDFLKKKKPVLFSQMTVGEPGGSGENEKEVDFEDEQRIWRGIGTVSGDMTPYIFEFREEGESATDNDRSTLALKALEDLRYTSWVQGTIGGTDFALKDYMGSILPEDAIDNQMATVAFDVEAADEAIADCYGYSLSDCYAVYEEYKNREKEWSDSLSVYLDNLEEYFRMADNPPREVSSVAPDEDMLSNSNIETVSSEGGYYLIDFPEGDIGNGYSTFYITDASVEDGMLKVEGLKSVISYDPYSVDYAGYEPWETDSTGNQLYKGEDVPAIMYLSYHPENSFSKFRLDGFEINGDISGTVPAD